MKASQIVTLSFLLGVILSACGKLSSGSPMDLESLTITPESEKIPSASAPLPAVSTTERTVTIAPESLSVEMVEKTKADLMERLGVLKEEIRIVDAKAVTWPDASLGCPKRGVMYVQMLTDGYVIQLEANGQKYEYHTDTGQNVILCDPDSGENNSLKNTDNNVQDGGPNQTKDRDVIFVTPTR